ncbi:Scn11a [Symbiodinium natans]|uniref:Scn11a protein n=1 Tax=Symbiodinium natans TaxID=878477 RepID=A0A812I7X7_9DINO|nr:Scn11a [Symbiodinium natans]
MHMQKYGRRCRFSYADCMCCVWADKEIQESYAELFYGAGRSKSSVAPAEQADAQGVDKSTMVQAMSEEDSSSPRRGEKSPAFSAPRSKSKSGNFADHIFGMIPDTDDKALPSTHGCCRNRLRWLIQNQWFDFLIMGMILIHTLSIGAQINHLAATERTDGGRFWRSVDFFFCVFFAIEVAMKVYVYRMRFFTMRACAWNIIDLVLAILQIVEEVMALVASATEEPYQNTSVMRAVRMMRGVKVLRLVRAVRYAGDLQLIVSCLILSLRTFLWSVLLLVMTIYVMAIYITQACNLRRFENPDAAGNDLLKKWWGDIFTSMLSVFQALSGGVDWNDVLQPIRAYVSSALAVFLVVYLAFCYLALLNVITGTFVETVGRQANDLKVRTQILQARRLFQQIDVDHSGFISLAEIQNQTATDAVIDFFESVDVDPSEAQYLLEVLDMDGSGTINFEEFLRGTLRLNGSARAADLLLVAREMKRFFVHTTAEMELIRTQLAAGGGGVRAASSQ